MAIEIFVGRELPAWSLFWLDDIGDPVDLSSGWTVAVSIRQGSTDTALSGATVTKNASPTTDTGASGDIPTLTVAPAAASLDSLVTGKATIIAVATSGSLDREQQWDALVRT